MCQSTPAEGTRSDARGPLARRLVAGLTAGLLVVLGCSRRRPAPAAAADLPAGAYLFAGVDTQLVAIDRVSGDVVRDRRPGRFPNDDGHRSRQRHGLRRRRQHGRRRRRLHGDGVAHHHQPHRRSRVRLVGGLARTGRVSMRSTRSNNLVDVFDPSQRPADLEDPGARRSFPWHMALSPDGSTIYVDLPERSSTVSVIDTVSPPRRRRQLPGPNTAEDVVFSPSGQHGVRPSWTDTRRHLGDQRSPSSTRRPDADGVARCGPPSPAPPRSALAVISRTGPACLPHGPHRRQLRAAGRPSTPRPAPPAPAVPVPDVPQYSPPQSHVRTAGDLYLALKGNSLSASTRPPSRDPHLRRRPARRDGGSGRHDRPGVRRAAPSDTYVGGCAAHRRGSLTQRLSPGGACRSTGPCRRG